jgi:hypothetical protein
MQSLVNGLQVFYLVFDIFSIGYIMDLELIHCCCYKTVIAEVYDLCFKFYYSNLFLSDS